MDTTAHTTNRRLARRAVPLLLGATVATWVGQTALLSPGEDYTAPDAAMLIVPITFAVFAAVLAHRAGMLRNRGSSIAVLGLTAFALLLYSIGLGLTAFGLGWVVAIVAVFGFAVTAVTSRLLLNAQR